MTPIVSAATGTNMHDRLSDAYLFVFLIICGIITVIILVYSRALSALLSAEGDHRPYMLCR